MKIDSNDDKKKPSLIETQERHGDKYLVFILEKYQELHQVETFDLDDVVKWALEELKYHIEPLTPAQMLKRKFSRAMSNEYFTDPQKREVRKYHPVRPAAKMGALGRNGQLSVTPIPAT